MHIINYVQSSQIMAAHEMIEHATLFLKGYYTEEKKFFHVWLSD